MQGSAFSNLHRQLGAAVREQRTALGLTQAALATRLDSDAAFVGRVERGAQNIRVTTFSHIFSVLNARSRATAPLQVPELTARPATHVFLEALAKTMGISSQVLHSAAGHTADRAAGPSKAHGEVPEEINPLERRLLETCLPCPRSATELQKALGYKTRTGNFKVGLNNLLAMGLMEMNMPNRPRSQYQKYRLTAKGRTWLAATRI